MSTEERQKRVERVFTWAAWARTLAWETGQELSDLRQLVVIMAELASNDLAGQLEIAADRLRAWRKDSKLERRWQEALAAEKTRKRT